MEVQFDSDGNPFIMWSGNKIHLENDTVLSKKDKEKAELELRETPENVAAGLEELRRLLKGEPNLVVPVDDDNFLMKFLRPCKFYPESAFQRIRAYYKFRQSHPEHCSDLTPNSVRLAFENSIVCALSPRDLHGRRSMLIDSAKWNPRDVSLTEVFRGMQIALEAALAEPSTQINGAITILDMKGLTFAQIMAFTPSYAKLIMDWIQDCLPLRFKEVHIVNQPYFYNLIYAIFKPFIRPKLRTRIFFHGTNREPLLTKIGAQALRKRHGGVLTEPELSGETIWKMLSHYEEQFKVANSYGYIDDSKKK